MGTDWGQPQREALAGLLFELALAIEESRRLRAEGAGFEAAEREVDRILRFAQELVTEGPPPIENRVEASQ